MTEQINDYFNNGLIAETFHAEWNMLIWQYVAEEVPFLTTQPQHIQDLFKFVQRSAQTNFILSLGKIFDTPNKKYPSRCILSFLELLTDENLNSIEIIEITNTKSILKKFSCSQELIEAVENPNLKLFPKLFSEHFQQKIKNAFIQDDINILKEMRDKAVAHNEAVGQLSIDFETIERLLSFVSELISIFGMAYHSTIWETENFSFLEKNVEDKAFFVMENILELST